MFIKRKSILNNEAPNRINGVNGIPTTYWSIKKWEKDEEDEAEGAVEEEEVVVHISFIECWNVFVSV